jgi:Mor family transcriptional regulator
LLTFLLLQIRHGVDYALNVPKRLCEWTKTMQTADWKLLPDEVQLVLSREAMRRAADTLAEHAEMLAAEMEDGALRDRGGPDALRLFAALVRTTHDEGFGQVGHA